MKTYIVCTLYYAELDDYTENPTDGAVFVIDCPEERAEAWEAVLRTIGCEGCDSRYSVSPEAWKCCRLEALPEDAEFWEKNPDTLWDRLSTLFLRRAQYGMVYKWAMNWYLWEAISIINFWRADPENEKDIAVLKAARTEDL